MDDDSKKVLDIIIEKYALSEIFSYFREYSANKASECADLVMKDAAKKWTSRTNLLEKLILNLKKI